VPYLKPLLRPADWGAFSDKRQGVAVMQTTPYSCGPATAATLLNALGTSATELDIAREARTSASGTENWYLARAIRNRGHSARFERSSAIVTSSIAGVTGGGYGHYIAVVSHNAGDYLVVDPLVGERRMTAEELTNRYDFTGFYLVVE
jgi:predicted double-glycine peptidase